MEQPPRFDLAIVGGGMVGASLARAASRIGLQTLVIEAQDAGAGSHQAYDDRAIALAHGSRRILESLGVWPLLASDSAAIRQVHISDRGRFGFARIHAQTHGLEALGYVATGKALGQALFAGLGELPGVTLLAPARLTRFVDRPQGVELVVEEQGQQHHYHCALLAAADGARSPVRRQLGIDASTWDYGQHALITNLSVSHGNRGIAYERFTDRGPLAMLPMQDGRYAMVWTLANPVVEQVMGLSEGQFLEQAQQRFGMRLGRFSKAGPRTSYPLKLIRASRQGRGRVLLIGNAAHAVHPITGQGFNLGIRDVAVLADLLYEASCKGEDYAAPALCQAYASARERDQRELALITDGLVRLFTSPLSPLRTVRDLGLTAIDNLPWAKGLVARRFMGYGGPQPRPARGTPFPPARPNNG
jgi:2-octaprenyl-6-methoxyphenol hydroxylase